MGVGLPADLLNGPRDQVADALRFEILGHAIRGKENRVAGLQRFIQHNRPVCQAVRAPERVGEAPERLGSARMQVDAAVTRAARDDAIPELRHESAPVSVLRVEQAGRCCCGWVDAPQSQSPVDLQKANKVVRGSDR